MNTDTELLRQYALERSESAFTELVRQHVNLVYSAALRENYGDAAEAEDLTQAVFTELAHKAPQLLHHPSLPGWLYTSVRHVAANQRRSNTRRRQREQSSMNDLPSPETPEATWSQIRPLLDDAMHDLNETDRAAVVQRFFEGQNLKDIGQSLGLSENAARMRVDRALDKLRDLLARRGINSTASGLAAALVVGCVLPAPPALAASIAASTLAGVIAATTPPLTSIPLMAMTKLQIGLVSVLIIAGVATPVWQQTRVNQLKQENAQLAQQVAQLEPRQKEAERLRAGGAPVSSELAQSRADVARLQAELAKLRGNAAEVMRKKSENTQLRNELAKKDSDATNETSNAMSDLMKSAVEQQIQGKVSRMKEKLNLSPEQSKAIEEILMAQMNKSTSIMQKIMSGKKVSSEDMPKPGSADGNPEQKVKDLLTPEQLNVYADFQNEENSGTARMAANMEAVQAQSSLSLSPEQQEKFASVLYDQSLKQLNGETAKAMLAAGGGSGNPTTDAFQFAMDQKIKALETVLTPEQMEKYRQLQETQLKYIKSLSSQMGLPSKGH